MFIELIGLLGDSNPIKFVIFNKLTGTQKTSLEELGLSVKILVIEDLELAGKASSLEMSSLIDKCEDPDKVIIVM